MATEFGVSRRTVERDLVALRAAGVPLFGQVGRGGGAGSIARSGRSVVALSDAEIVALVIAAHLARDAPFATAASTAIGKLLDALDDSSRIAVVTLRQRFRVALPAISEVSARVRSVLEDGVRHQTVVRLAYTDRHGKPTDRRVEPVGFYSADGEWSLVAWCRTRHAGRMFVLHRIRRATPTSETFVGRDVDAVLGWVPQFGDAP